jgi:hypothetical protein
MSASDRADGATPSHPDRPQQGCWFFVERPADGEADDTPSREDAPSGRAVVGNALVIGETSSGKCALPSELFAQALWPERGLRPLSSDLRRRDAHRAPAKPA